MHRVGSTGRRGATAIGAAFIALVTLSACTSGNDNRPDAKSSVSTGTGTASPDSSSAPGAPSTSSSAAAPAAVTVAATGGVTKANPGQPVTVNVANGTLTAVTLKNAAGKTVKGALGTGATSWSTSEDLGYSKTYTLTAVSKDAAGRAATKTQKIKTVSPSNLTQPYLNDIYGSALDPGATYGVGMVISAYFDEDIPDKTAATKALQVTTSPHVDGAWYWTTDHTAHWRPQQYYAPGTQVSVTAKV